MGVGVVSKLSLHETVGCVFGAHVVGCVVKLLLYYVPAQMVAIPVAVLSLASIRTLHQASLRTPGLGKRLPTNAGSDSSETYAMGKTSTSSIGDVWRTDAQGSWGPTKKSD